MIGKQQQCFPLDIFLTLHLDAILVSGHPQLAVAPLEDSEGLAKQAVLRTSNEQTYLSLLRVLKKRLIRLPSVLIDMPWLPAGASCRRCLQGDRCAPRHGQQRWEPGHQPDR